jgi:hypothetical protein
LYGVQNTVFHLALNRFLPVPFLDGWADFAYYMAIGYAFFMLACELYKDLIKY